MFIKLVFFMVFVSRVTPWMVDLTEVKKFVEQKDRRAENEVLFNYAKEFGYQGVNERKWNSSSVLVSGGSYLEGLSRALMAYRETLNNCSKSTVTENKSSVEESTKCLVAMKNSEYIQKLSDLALITTNKLRDKASDNKDDSRDENELVLQLAWLLDRLALVTGTGFQINPKQNLHTDTGNETKTLEKPTPINETPLELLEQVESRDSRSKFPPKKTAAVKNIVNVKNITDVKSIRKRSAANTLKEILTYYVKYKIWNSSNSLYLNSTKENKKQLETERDSKSKSVSKRDVKTISNYRNNSTDTKKKIKKIKIMKRGNDLKFKNKVKLSKLFKSHRL